MWGGVEGTIDTSSGGYTAYDNVTVDPEFVNAAAHDYEMSPTSPCLALVGDVQAAVDGTAPVQPPAVELLPRRRRRPAAPPGGTTGHGSAKAPAKKTAKRNTTLKRKRVAHAAKRRKEKRRKRRKAKPHTTRR